MSKERLIAVQRLSDCLRSDKGIQYGFTVTYGATDFDRLQVVSFGAIPNGERTCRKARISSSLFPVKQRIVIV